MVSIAGNDLNTHHSSSIVMYSAGTLGTIIPGVRIGNNFALVGTLAYNGGVLQKVLQAYAGPTVNDITLATTTTHAPELRHDPDTGQEPLVRRPEARRRQLGPQRVHPVRDERQQRSAHRHRTALTISNGTIKSGGNFGTSDNVYLTNDVDLTISANIQTMGLAKNALASSSFPAVRASTGTTTSPIIMLGQGRSSTDQPPLRLSASTGASWH